MPFPVGKIVFCMQLGEPNVAINRLEVIMLYDEVFTFEHLFECFKQCCKGVRWKPSTQIYEAQAVRNVCETLNHLKKRNYKSKGFHTFYIHERGKVRFIQSIHISERVVQKCLCNYCLTPTFRPTFIYDNGACMKGKGTHFAVRRLKTHLLKYYKEHGNKGYVLIFDLHDYFNSINHEILLQKVRQKITDDDLFNIYKYFVSCFEGNGLGLGSQISQISSSIYLNGLDHYIKEKLHIKFYGRYMDDGYLISNSKWELQECLEGIKKELQDLKIELNLKKTKIVKIQDGFRFLKRTFYLKPDGKIIMKPYKKNIQKYKTKYRKLCKKGVSQEALDILQQTFIGYLKEFHYKDNYTRRIVECLDQKNCQKSQKMLC